MTSPLANLHELPVPQARVDERGIRSVKGLIYAVVDGFRPLKLDVYLPETGAAPLLVYVHGGAFKLGDRGTLARPLAEVDLFARLPRDGVAIASIDYRLSGEAVFPAQLHDVRAAIRWLRRRAHELDVDGGRIALWGESAGGHLAALAGVTSNEPELPGEDGVDGVSSAVCAVVDWYGPTDFSQMDAQAPAHPALLHDTPDSPESLLLGAPVPEAPELVRAANPCSYVTPDAPPFLIQHGTHDRVVPYGQSVLLYETLRAAGCDVELQAVEGADHVFDGVDDPATVVEPALAFLRRRFAHSPLP
jgi:acetyl esterase/lipase